MTTLKTEESDCTKIEIKKVIDKLVENECQQSNKGKLTFLKIFCKYIFCFCCQYYPFKCFKYCFCNCFCNCFCDHCLYKCCGKCCSDCCCCEYGKNLCKLRFYNNCNKCLCNCFEEEFPNCFWDSSCAKRFGGIINFFGKIMRFFFSNWRIYCSNNSFKFSF